MQQQKGAGTAANAGQPDTGTPSGGGPGGKKGRGGGGAIPIVAVKAQRGNIGVYYSGLGAVTPISTVTVKSRVDGQLMSIHYQEGDMVKQGDLLAEIDPRPYQATLLQYEGQLLRDQALLQNAKVDATRYETLLKQNAIPEQQLATQKSLVSQQEGVVKTDQGLIEAVKLNLTYCNITAPITGRIGLRLVDPGNIVHAADTNGLLVITQLQPISVIFTIAEDQLATVLQKLHSGQRLPVDAYDRDMQKRIASGVLTTTDNVIDQTTGTLKLRSTFSNSNSELFPNQFVNARLLVQEKTGIILLPTAAIQRNTQMTYAWTVKPDNSVTVRQIALGTTEGDRTEITSGLQEGDTVVMTGVDKLQEGTKVTVHFEGEKPPADEPPTGRLGGTGRGQGGGKGKRAQ
jgi:multidrug efflux system membrane fusion protein